MRLRTLVVSLGIIFLLLGGKILPEDITNYTQKKKFHKKSKSIEERSVLYKSYLAKGELDAKLICNCYFPQMSPEEINKSLCDIRQFLRAVLRAVIKDESRKADETFLINILHIHGYIINFIEDAWLNLDTKKVFVAKKGRRITGNVMQLARYWSYLEQQCGEKLHCYKFYASCIDYLIVFLRSRFLVPCKDGKALNDMESRWLHWLVERLWCKLDGHMTFGGYYGENIELFRQIFQAWKSDFEKKQELKRARRQ